MEILWLLVFPAIGFLCFKAAEQKGRSRWIWGLIGTVNPPLGLIFVACLPRIRHHEAF